MIINGLNAETSFGLVLADGAYNVLWTPPRAKPGYEYNWPDQNGIETDPDQPQVFERIEYSLPLILTATDEADYWDKFHAFCQFVYSNRNIILDIPERNRRFKLVNMGISNYDEAVDGYRPNALLRWELANDNPTEFLKVV